MRWKEKVSLIVVTIAVLLPALVGGSVFADGAWIGTGSGSGSASGGPEKCKSSTNYFQEECAGYSWALYTASKKTNKNTAFPQLISDSGLTVQGATIPKECSEHGKDAGVWHKGVNLINGCISGNSLNQGSSNCGGKQWTGHWYTIANTSWLTYYNGNPSMTNPQSFGVYTLKKFATSSNGPIKAYNEALKSQNRNAKKVDSIPSNVWGFCWWPDMDKHYYTLTVKSVLENGGSLAHLQADKSDTKEVGKELSVTVDEINGYTFLGFRVNQNTGTAELGTGTGGRTIKITPTKDKDQFYRYAVYKPNPVNPPKVKLSVVAVDIDTRGVLGGAIPWRTSGEVDKGQNATVTTSDLTAGGYQYPPVGWSKSITTAESALENKGLTSYTWNNMQENSTVYAFFKKIPPPPNDPEYVTLSGVAVDYNTGQPIGQCDPASHTVQKGQMGVIFKVACNYGTFKGWTGGRGALSAKSNSYPWPNMQQNETVKLLYKRNVKNVTLRGVAIDISTHERIGFQYDPAPVTLPQGSNFTLHSKEVPDYDKLGWSPELYGTPEGSPNGYTWINMQEDNTVYVFYRKRLVVSGECGNWTPASYVNSNAETQATTSTVSKVANTTLSSGWQDLVYAKPTDSINWIHCYYPGVQKMADALFSTAQHKDTENNPTCSETSSSCYRPSSYSLNNKPLQEIITFENKFRVNRDFTPGLTDTKTYAVGDATAPDPYEDNDYGVLTSQVGNTLVENITTGQPIEVSRQLVEKGPVKWDCNWGYYKTVNHHDLIKDKECTTDKDGKETCTDPVYHDWSEDLYKWHDVCEHDDYITKSVTTGPTSSHADVKVPYNFKNRIELNEVDKSQETGLFYAGENKTMYSTIYTEKRENGTLQGEYATRVPNAKIKLELCYNQTNCYETTPKSIADLNSGGDMEGDTRENASVSFNVPDLPAGTEICMRSAVYPKDSNGDLSMTTDTYSVSDRDSWSWSEPICARVAKRPSVQVLGGNVYSNGKIVTGISKKNLLYGWYSENDQNAIDSSRGNGRTFGSWGELGVISQGSVRGFASGEKLGYGAQGYLGSQEMADMTVPNRHWNDEPATSTPGGNTSSTLCPTLSPLTVANSCSGSLVSGTGGSGSSSGTNGDLTSLRQLADSYSSSSNSGRVQELNGGGVGIDGRDEKVFYHVNGDAEIGGISLGDAIHLLQDSYTVVKVDGDAKIVNDIEVLDKGTYAYNTLSQLPKMVIYARNIDIACNVEQIDAVLVAEGTVTTCAPDDADLVEGDNSDDNPYNDTKNLSVFSSQLVVNGAIVTRKINLTRTYGAGRGQNSIVSAEVINFDPSLYLWGGIAGEKKDNTNALNGDLEITYVHELAPRQ